MNLMYVRIVKGGAVEIIHLGKRFRRARVHLVINPVEGLFLPGEKSRLKSPELNPDDITHLILLGDLDLERVTKIAEVVNCTIVCSTKNLQELVKAGINKKRVTVFEQGKFTDEQCWLLADELEVSEERKRLIDSVPVLDRLPKLPLLKSPKLKLFKPRFITRKASFIIISFDEGENRLVIPLDKYADKLLNERLDLYNPKLLLLPREIDVAKPILEKTKIVQFSSKKRREEGKQFLTRDEWIELDDLF